MSFDLAVHLVQALSQTNTSSPQHYVHTFSEVYELQHYGIVNIVHGVHYKQLANRSSYMSEYYNNYII